MASVLITRPGKLEGEFFPPGDKSISHRAIMFGALSKGTSTYTHFLQGEDCLHTMQAFQAMGIDIRLDESTGTVVVHGKGVNGLKDPARELYLGNSGTSTRLLLGILAGQRFEVTLSGDPSLSSRPMRRVTDPLKKMGAQIKGRDNGNYAPLTIRGGKLQGIDFENKLASAQVKSAILFAGLYAEGQTRVHEPLLSRDHTERFLAASGAKYKKEGDWIIVEKSELNAMDGKIPGDISAAAFFMVGAAMTPGSDVTIRNVCLNPTRTGIIAVLQRMGAKLEVRETAKEPEPLGDIHISGTRLKGTGITKQEIPSLIDELPVIMVAMALAEGESLISGAEELRVKETDRIHSMVTNLKKVGGDIDELPDGCVLRGVERLKGGTQVESFADHRTAMSMAIATLVMDGDLTIEDTACVATSFPTFFKDFERLKQGK